MNLMLRERRQSAKTTHREISHRTGISPARYIGIEREWWEPTKKEIGELCNLFDAKPDDLGLWLVEPVGKR